MARLIVTVKIMPSDINVNLNDVYEQLKSTLPKEYSVLNYEIVPIAFGLKSLLVNISMPEEKEGGTSELEDIISNMDNVQSVEVLRVSRTF